DGRQKPEVSAPGHNVFAAASTSVTGTTRMSGTSMASPMVTGTVALLLAEAAARQHDLSIADIRTVLLDSARHNPPAAQGWEQRVRMIMKVRTPDYVPRDIEVRTRVDPNLFTAESNVGELQKLQDDPHVESIEISEVLGIVGTQSK